MAIDPPSSISAIFYTPKNPKELSSQIRSWLERVCSGMFGWPSMVAHKDSLATLHFLNYLVVSEMCDFWTWLLQLPALAFPAALKLVVSRWRQGWPWVSELQSTWVPPWLCTRELLTNLVSLPQNITWMKSKGLLCLSHFLWCSIHYHRFDYSKYIEIRPGVDGCHNKDPKSVALIWWRGTRQWGRFLEK